MVKLPIPNFKIISMTLGKKEREHFFVKCENWPLDCQECFFWIEISTFIKNSIEHLKEYAKQESCSPVCWNPNWWIISSVVSTNDCFTLGFFGGPGGGEVTERFLLTCNRKGKSESTLDFLGYWRKNWMSNICSVSAIGHVTNRREW